MGVAPRALRIAPSLLSADFADLADAIAHAEAGGADAFHLDVMDGQFVPNISFGPALVSAVRRRTRRPLDVHLMIERPDRYAKAFADAGGDTLAFHLEAGADTAETIRMVRGLGARVGVAIRPETPFERLAPLLDRLDEVMVMSVHPGFSGQKFLPEALPKLRAARSALDALGSPADLVIDGGITAASATEAAAAGATFFVCGNSVFGGGSVEANLREIRSAVDQGAHRALR